MRRHQRPQPTQPTSDPDRVRPTPTPATGWWAPTAGIFSFGAATFHGSTGTSYSSARWWAWSRPRITTATGRSPPTAGVFAFGDAGFYGSIPGLGIAPAGTAGAAHRLNAPIVAIVPSTDGRGYFMVAADGGVFAFGDATFAGSCPGIGTCPGSAVSVLPDTTGKGYWLVTSVGAVYAFGDAPFEGAPGPTPSPITSAVHTLDGAGYWILTADGSIYA